MAMQSVRPKGLNHINAVVEDFDESIRHMQNVFGADWIMDLPQAEWHAALVDFGRVLFEFFVPPAFLMNARYGPYYLGVEYQVDMDKAREAVASHGIRIIRDKGGHAFHTDPRDSFGVSFEFTGGYFVDREWPMIGGKMKPAEYWRDQHDLAITGLGCYSIGVFDLDKTSRFLQSFLQAEPIYVEDRPNISGRALGLRIADTMVELLAPLSDGHLKNHLYRHGEGLYSTVFAVKSLDSAQTYFSDKNISLKYGSSESRFSLQSSDNLGILFEFMEHLDGSYPLPSPE